MIKFILFTLCIVYFSFAQDFKKFEITYNVKVLAKKGELSVWVPLPKTTPLQKVLDIDVNSNYPYKINYDRKFKNRILYINVSSPKDDIKITVKAVVKRFKADNQNVDKRKYLLKYALEEGKYIPISKKIRELAEKISGNEKDVLKIAKKLYEHTLDKLEYDKSVPGWGKGDFFYAQKVCKGNCTDFHTYFITLARNLGIPSIFIIGFPIPEKIKQGEIRGYHCWAAFWYKDHWVPVDISEADKNLSKTDYYFGNLDPYRVEISVGRDIILEPGQKEEPLNYFIYPYVEINGKKYKNVHFKINFRILN